MAPRKLTGAEVAELPSAYVGILKGDMRRILLLFEAWDENNDNCVQVEELKKGMLIQQRDQPSAKEFRHLWSCLDPDGTGSVPIPELHAAMLAQLEALKQHERAVVERKKRAQQKLTDRQLQIDRAKGRVYSRDARTALYTALSEGRMHWLPPAPLQMRKSSPPPVVELTPPGSPYRFRTPPSSRSTSPLGRTRQSPPTSRSSTPLADSRRAASAHTLRGPGPKYRSPSRETFGHAVSVTFEDSLRGGSPVRPLSGGAHGSRLVGALGTKWPADGWRHGFDANATRDTLRGSSAFHEDDFYGSPLGHRHSAPALPALQSRPASARFDAEVRTPF